MSPSKFKNVAIVGAGMAGVACARTLLQAGHRVQVFEKSHALGGRMATRNSAFGSFDHGAQYFTVRDPRFERALQTVPGLCKRWSANAVQVLDEHGRVAAASLAAREAHWVPTPSMNALVSRWGQPLVDQAAVHFETKVKHLDRDALHPHQWELHTQDSAGGRHVYGGFDAVLLAIPAEPARLLLNTSPLADHLSQQLDMVQMAPCWTLMLAFPQAMQPGLSALGPQWNAARSTHHRIAWLARESSKPGRITGIRAEPAHVDSRRWRFAQTTQPLGHSHLWDAQTGLGVCGDWCLGHRVEDAFVSGLELALTVA